MRYRKGPPKIFDTDEHPRSDVSMEELSRLPAVFKKNGTVTAGNSSGINDGASALVLMSGKKSRRVGSEVDDQDCGLRIGCSRPGVFWLWPGSGDKKVLKRANLSLQDMELIEVNEAFAGQYLTFEKELG